MGEVSAECAVGGVVASGLWPLVVVDADERPLLVADSADELAAANGAGDRLRRRCDEVRGGARFGLLVSPTSIRIFEAGRAEPVLKLATADVLGSYHPTWHLWQRAPRHLMTLVEAWLSDLAWGWRGLAIPGEAELSATGLVAQLRAAQPLHVHLDEQGGLRP